MTSPEPALSEGAGVFSGYSDLYEATQAEDQNAAVTGAAALGAGLDTLGLAMDPLGHLAEAGVGWLIEHIDFLREGLDNLCGNAEVIKNRAAIWERLADELAGQAAEHRQNVSDLAGWEGAAANAYLAAGRNQASDLDDAARLALSLAETVLRSGAMVGMERALIRDAIAELVVRLAEWLVASIISAGIALAAAISSAVASAANLAFDISDGISTLLRRLEEMSAFAGRTADALDDVATRSALNTDTFTSRPLLPEGLTDGARELRNGLESHSGLPVLERLRSGDAPAGLDAPKPFATEVPERLARLEDGGGVATISSEGLPAAVEVGKNGGAEAQDADDLRDPVRRVS